MADTAKDLTKKTTAQETSKKTSKKTTPKAGAKAVRAKKEVAEAKAAVVKAKAVKKPAAKKTVKKTAPKAKKVVAEPIYVVSRVAPKPVPQDAKFRWYVVQTLSNYEKRVQSLIREQIILQGMQNFIQEVLIPVEKVTEIKKGQKVESDRKFFPGYVLIKCFMVDNVWHLIKSTPHITSFVGAEAGRKPLPISNREAEHILKQMEDGVEAPKSAVTFEIGEEVRVVDGPFNSFNGSVEMVDEDKERLRVSVSIFGRATPIDLDYRQVEKA